MSAGASVRLLTPPGVGGIAVVELSGDAGGEILRGCFRAAGAGAAVLEPGRVHYGHVLDGDEVLDEVLVACVPVSNGAPVLEINCHGGMVPARRLMDVLIEQGVAEGPPPGLGLGRKLARLERELL